MKRHFSKEDAQIANKGMKRHPTLVVIMEMQIEIAMRYPFTPCRMVIKKKNKNRK